MRRSIHQHALAIDELIDQLGALSAKRRYTAARKLSELGAEATGPLIARFKRESHNRRYNAAKCVAVTCAATAFYFWLMPQLINPARWLLLLALLPLVYVVMHLNAWNPMEIQSTRLLSQIDDINAIGPLAEALASRGLWTVSDTRSLAAEGLGRLLPKMTSQDGELLNTSQREVLYRALDHAGLFDPELTRGIIHAMHVIGDERAERPLRRLISNRYFVGRHTEMQAEAEEALQAIHDRVSLSKAPDMLLRASEPETRSELLLRSTKPRSETHDSQLLRVTSTDSDKIR